MNTERFQELADAFGADLRRWPDLERFTAERFLRDSPQEARAILDGAAELDVFLDKAASAAPSLALKERIIALAPRQLRPAFTRRGAWASGAGLAAACVLGVMVGANVSASFLADPNLDTVIEASTAFDEPTYFSALENEG